MMWRGHKVPKRKNCGTCTKKEISLPTCDNKELCLYLSVNEIKAIMCNNIYTGCNMSNKLEKIICEMLITRYCRWKDEVLLRWGMLIEIFLTVYG